MPVFSFSQKFANFSPQPHQINTDSLSTLLKKNRESYIKNHIKEDPTIITLFRKDYDERINEIILMCKKGYLFSDDTLSRYLKSIIYKLQASSPFIKKDIILFLTKTLVPNAASWGDNIIMVNTGLLTKYKNEGELAFILGHELAHDYEDHVIKSVKNDYLISKKLKYERKFRKAERAKYQTTNKINAVIEEYLSAINSYSRKDELQADSLGFVLLTKAGYSPRAGVNSLKILQTVDDNFFPDKLNLKNLLDGTQHPFQEKWLQTEEVTNYTLYREKMNDSINTHPDCQNRIKALVNVFHIDTLSPYDPNTDLDYIVNTSFFENMRSCFENKDYLYSLYYALQLEQRFPGNSFATNIGCASLYHIGFALKKHRFSKIVPLPHPDFDSDLNSLISFLNNLSFTDYKNLSRQFLGKFTEGKSADPYLNSASFYCEAFGLSDQDLLEKIKAMNTGSKNPKFEDIINTIEYEKN
ncbi:MAG: M48 family metallopeptidase [Bacteroidia bacterium]